MLQRQLRIRPISLSSGHSGGPTRDGGQGVLRKHLPIRPISLSSEHSKRPTRVGGQGVLQRPSGRRGSSGRRWRTTADPTTDCTTTR